MNSKFSIQDVLIS